MFLRFYKIGHVYKVYSDIFSPLHTEGSFTKLRWFLFTFKINFLNLSQDENDTEGTADEEPAFSPPLSLSPCLLFLSLCLLSLHLLSMLSRSLFLSLHALSLSL